MSFVVRYTMVRKSITDKFLGMQAEENKAAFDEGRENAKTFGGKEYFDISVDGLTYFYEIIFQTENDYNAWIESQTNKDEFERWAAKLYENEDLKITKETYETS